MSENRCVVCGEIIPEGNQVCGKCQKQQTQYGGRVTDSCGGTRFKHGTLTEVVNWADKELEKENVREVSLWRVGKK